MCFLWHNLRGCSEKFQLLNHQIIYILQSACKLLIKNVYVHKFKQNFLLKQNLRNFPFVIFTRELHFLIIHVVPKTKSIENNPGGNGKKMGSLEKVIYLPAARLAVSTHTHRFSFSHGKKALGASGHLSRGQLSRADNDTCDILRSSAFLRFCRTRCRRTVSRLFARHLDARERGTRFN